MKFVKMFCCGVYVFLLMSCATGTGLKRNAEYYYQRGRECEIANDFSGAIDNYTKKYF